MTEASIKFSDNNIILSDKFHYEEILSKIPTSKIFEYMADNGYFEDIHDYVDIKDNDKVVSIEYFSVEECLERVRSKISDSDIIGRLGNLYYSDFNDKIELKSFSKKEKRKVLCNMFDVNFYTSEDEILELIKDLYNGVY